VAINKNKRVGTNQFLILLTGIIVLAGSILTYIFVLRGVYGRFSTSYLMPDVNLVKKVTFGTKPKVAILYSRYTENMLPKGSSWVNDNVKTWEKFVGGSKFDFDVISDQDVELGKVFNYNLLIIPGSKSLSDREIIEIKKFINEGGSIFASGGIATYSDEGKWRGWDFLSEVFGCRFAGEVKSGDATKIHTLRGGLPLTANIPPGYPLKIATWDRPIAAQVLDPRAVQASFWYNYRLEGGLTRLGIKKSAGIVYGRYGAGRFVWMGFEINSIIGIQEDYIYFDRLFNNCMHWLSYVPIAYIKSWPGNYSAAAVIAPELSSEVKNIDNLIPVLKKDTLRATFFVDPQIAIQNKNLVRSLTNYGEVAAISDIGYLSSVNDTSNKLDSYDVQLQKLKNAKSTIESITNSTVHGFLPYYSLFDQNTIQALIKSNYSYVLTDSLTDRSVPKTVVRGEKRVSIMTKAARDDYEVIRDFDLTSNDFQFYTYQEDVDRTLFEGGMYIFKMHTQYQCTNQNIGVVDRVIQDLKKKNFWITTFSDIQKWYSRRDRLEIRADRRGETRVAVNVSNPGKFTLNNLTIEVYLNDNAKNVGVSTEIIGTKKAKVKHEYKSKKVLLYLNDLKPGESRTYYIDYDKVNA